jgi:glyoxylase-like metal-dependent hydrolase (beta-lactamase superfamily II)
MDNHTEELAPGVWRVEVAPYTNAFVLADDAGRLTLVDTGTRRSGPRLVRSVRLLGFPPTSIDHIVLTHWHADHTGSAARFAESSAAPAVWVGRGDLPAVQGHDQRPQAAAVDATPTARLLGRWTGPGPAVASAQPVDDGQVLPTAGGAVVVATPGHTPGHISLHLADRGVLLAGDAVMNLLWLSRGFGPFRSARSREAATLRRMADLDFEVLAAGHGPPITTAARSRLRRLADRVS